MQSDKSSTSSPSSSRKGTAQGKCLSLRRRLFYYSIIYAVFLLLLLAVEGVTRLMTEHISPLEMFIRTPQQRAQLTDRQKAGIFDADPLLLWRLKPNLDHVIWDFTMVSTNAQGLRYEHKVEGKEPGAVRIVSLGDSVTFGYRAPVVWPERPSDYNPEWLPYPAVLESRLREANPGRKVEVIPLAVPGYTTHQGVAWLKREIETLDPDLVIICFGWNDVSMSDRPDRDTISTGFLPVITRRIVFHSQTLLHLLYWFRAKLQTFNAQVAPVPEPRVSEEEYVNNLLEMVKIAREHQASVMVIGSVYRDRITNPPEAVMMSSYRASARNAMRQAGVPYMEIKGLTEDGYPANEKIFGELVHPNHIGYRLMASAILDFMRERRILCNVSIPEGQEGAGHH